MNHSNSSIFNSELSDFTRLAKRILLLVSPFLIAAIFIIIVDPFNFFNYSHIVPDQIKEPIAKQFNPPFWKLNKFDKELNENILLGDSRMAPISTDKIKEISSESYANLGYGGASVREIIDSFWFVTKKVKLKKVFINVSLDKYNDYEITSRLNFYKSANENPFLYFVNRAVWEAAYYDLKIHLTGEKFMVGTPDMNKDEFWKEEIAIEKKYYEKYAEPKKYRRELNEIAEYCSKNNIELAFIIFPTHVDAQKLIVETNMSNFRESMINDLTSWGKVYNFDWENELTENRENFEDPVHATEIVRTELIEEIWGNKIKFVKILPKL